jgi:biotin transport system substrate-specific component
MTIVASVPMQPTLSDVLWPSARGARHLLLVLVGSGLLTISAKLQIPLWPVPMTMQTYVVLVLGMTYGPRLGTLTVLFYLAQGALGVPVFAGTPEKGLGLPYMLGPTGGYLLGFLLAVAVSGWLARRGWDRSAGWTLLAMTLGHAVIFVPGVSWLAMQIGWERAVASGLTPFCLATVAKTALGVVTMPVAWRLLGRSRA